MWNLAFPTQSFYGHTSTFNNYFLNLSERWTAGQWRTFILKVQLLITGWSCPSCLVHFLEVFLMPRFLIWPRFWFWTTAKLQKAPLGGSWMTLRPAGTVILPAWRKGDGEKDKWKNDKERRTVVLKVHRTCTGEKEVWADMPWCILFYLLIFFNVWFSKLKSFWLIVQSHLESLRLFTFHSPVLFFVF